MKIFTKIILGYFLIVILFGAAVFYSDFQDNKREQENIIKLYEERAVSIAKTLDTTIQSEEQLTSGNFAQEMVDKLMHTDIGVYEFSVHAKAPEGISDNGYWRLASNDSAIAKEPSDPEDLDAIKEDKYNVLFEEEDANQIIDVTYPLHDNNGKAIATAGIKFSMNAISGKLTQSHIYLYTILMILVALLLGALISNSITKPIIELAKAADKVTNGDLEAVLPIAKANTELGRLASSIEMVITVLKNKDK